MFSVSLDFCVETNNPFFGGCWAGNSGHKAHTNTYTITHIDDGIVQSLSQSQNCGVRSQRSKQHKTIWLDSRDCFRFGCGKIMSVDLHSLSSFQLVVSINAKRKKYTNKMKWLSDRLGRQRNDWERGKRYCSIVCWSRLLAGLGGSLVHTLNIEIIVFKIVKDDIWVLYHHRMGVFHRPQNLAGNKSAPQHNSFRRWIL